MPLIDYQPHLELSAVCALCERFIKLLKRFYPFTKGQSVLFEHILGLNPKLPCVVVYVGSLIGWALRLSVLIG